MTNPIDMRMLERAGLTLEQWRAVDEFFRHNTGNLLGGLLPLVEHEELVGAEVAELGRIVHSRYEEIKAALQNRAAGVHRGGAAREEGERERARHQGMITTGDTGEHGEEEENGDHELHELHEEGNGE